MSQLPESRYFVEPGWIDRLGHMTAAKYVAVFDECSDRMLETYGLGRDYTATSRCGLFTVDLRTQFRREVVQGDPIWIRARIIAVDEKRLLTYFEMTQTRDNYVAATFEQLAIHASLETRKSVVLPHAARRALEDAMVEHREAPLPPGFHSSLWLGSTDLRTLHVE